MSKERKVYNGVCLFMVVILASVAGFGITLLALFFYGILRFMKFLDIY